MVNEAMHEHEYVPASEMKLTSPSEVLESSGHSRWQGAWPEQCFKQGPETSTKARDNLSHESVQRSPPQAVLPTNMETRSRGIRTEAGKETHEAFFLQTLTFT
jgi:hypothetical protein